MPRLSRKFAVDSKTGKSVELTAPEDKAVLDAIAIQTSLFKRDLFAEDSLPGKNTRHVAKWPIVSTAAGVCPEDVPAAQAILRDHGVHTEYTREGDPIFRDRSHRKEHCKALGFIDRDGGYGDWTD